MKIIVIALACLLATVSALPNQQSKELESAIRSGNTRLVTGSIVDAIENLAQSLRDAGLDPLAIDQEIDYALPVPSILNAKAALNGFLFSGLSNIVINRMNYAVLTSRLTFNIELPEISTSVGLAQWDVNFFDRNLNGVVSGRVAVNNVVVTGDIRVNIGIITGISIRSMEVTFSLGGIQSNLNVLLQGVNLSRQINNYLGETIPGTLKAYESDINQLITIVAREVVEQNL
ncbi:uncharacterized protein LOC133519689 [Cydia pomonella]|uniref:uncharacterized protein LOC133519689 n=1 Tax=Cydia pomonella TaxID=82600 RepID=UPI002ADD5E35|nr:uncharacterized protein LOC133519689 [Cydia pomonella]